MDNEVKYLYLDDIIPNRFQPRENFDEQGLKELAVSISEHGVIQPIVVRQIGEKYEIIAGERRYKASTMAGLTKIPAIIRNLDDKESSKVALIENLQRKDLTPIEEARTYQKILEIDSLTQEELARTMGKTQSAVSNKLRLLSLTDEVQDALLNEQISERHARALLNVSNPQKQIELLNKIISSRMTVRELEEEIKKIDDNNGGQQKVIMPQYNEPVKPEIINNENLNNTNGLLKNNVSDNLSNISMESVDSKSQDSSNFDKNNLFSNLNAEMSNESTIKKHDDAEGIDVIGGSELLAGMSPLEAPHLDKNNNNTEVNVGSNLYSNIKSTNSEAENLIPEVKLSDDNIPNVTNSSIKQSNGKTEEMSGFINKIKDTVKNSNNMSKKVEMEEFDFDDFYQLVIRIDK